MNGLERKEEMNEGNQNSPEAAVRQQSEISDPLPKMESPQNDDFLLADSTLHPRDPLSSHNEDRTSLIGSVD